jgi:catechol 2,3-dioxygenase-like lactoylglutathione lyase family enzyme
VGASPDACVGGGATGNRRPHGSSRATLLVVEDASPGLGDDDRPALWVGHVVLATHDVARAFDFYRDLGLRPVDAPRPGVGLAQLEMRGGTHLALVLDSEARTVGRSAPFDLMADDLRAFHDMLEGRGVDVSPITGSGHASFTFRDPDGHVVTVNDTHVTGAV